MTPFYGWGTNFSSLESSWGQRAPDTCLIDSEEWTGESAFRPPSSCEPGTPVREPYFSEILITVAEYLVLRTSWWLLPKSTVTGTRCLELAMEGISRYQNKIDHRVFLFVNLEQIWHLSGKFFFQKLNTFSKWKNLHWLLWLLTSSWHFLAKRG